MLLIGAGTTWATTRGGESKDSERVAALEKAIEGLITREKGIRLEWEDVYDRLNRTMGRLNARIRKQQGQEAPDETAAPPEAPAGPVGTHAVLEQARRRRA